MMTRRRLLKMMATLLFGKLLLGRGSGVADNTVLPLSARDALQIDMLWFEGEPPTEPNDMACEIELDGESYQAIDAKYEVWKPMGAYMDGGAWHYYNLPFPAEWECKAWIRGRPAVALKQQVEAKVIWHGKDGDLSYSGEALVDRLDLRGELTRIVLRGEEPKRERTNGDSAS